MSPSFFDAIADLLEYPVEEQHQKLVEARSETARTAPQELSRLLEFSRAVERLELSELQELYTQTFDLNPVCALEIGYHLFGENYKRGELLANLRETETPYELGEQNQLPDYLPVVLRLLGRLEDRELRESLIAYCVLPALRKMIDAFGDKANPFREILVVLLESLGREAPEQVEIPNDTPELYQISAKADRRQSTVAPPGGAGLNPMELQK